MFGKKTRTEQPTNHAVITDTAPCQKSLRLIVAHDEIAPIRSVVLLEFQKQAALPGFRKGKAPAELVERQYAKSIHEETLQRVTQQAIQQATKEHHLNPVGPIALTRADFSETNGFTLEATIEVEPSFALGRYKGIVLTRPSEAVTSDEVEHALGRLQESMAQMVPAKEGEAKERQVPPLDDELAKDLGFERLSALREHVEAKLREQKRVAASQALEADLCETLLTRHAFDVPPRLVAHQTERLTRDFKVRLLLSGMPEDTLDEEVTKFTEQLRTSAERHVKLGFIVERIATQESVTVAQEEVVQRLWQLSQRWKKDPAHIRKQFDAQGLWPSVVSTIRQEKTIAILLAASAIQERAPAVTPAPTPQASSA